MVPGVTGTLDEKAIGALGDWVRSEGIGTEVTDVVPLAGGSQNVVVRLKIDGRSLVLRRAAHPGRQCGATSGDRRLV